MEVRPSALNAALRVNIIAYPWPTRQFTNRNMLFDYKRKDLIANKTKYDDSRVALVGGLGVLAPVRLKNCL